MREVSEISGFAGVSGIVWCVRSLANTTYELLRLGGAVTRRKVAQERVCAHDEARAMPSDTCTHVGNRAPHSSRPTSRGTVFHTCEDVPPEIQNSAIRFANQSCFGSTQFLP